MFCTKCGRELQDGEVCTCTQTNGEANMPRVDENPVDNGQDYYQENNNAVYYQGAYYNPNQAYNQENPAKNKDIPARTDYPEGYKIKKKYVAVLLAWTFGMYGIHNFYLGKSDKALAQVLLSTVGAILTVGLSFIAVCIWATVEAVLLLTEKSDKDGNGYKIQTLEESIAKQINKD